MNGKCKHQIKHNSKQINRQIIKKMKYKSNHMNKIQLNK